MPHDQRAGLAPECDASQQIAMLLRAERIRQWLTMAMWSPVLVLTFGTVLLLEFATLTMQGGLGAVPAGPAQASTRTLDLFDTLTATWGVAMLASPLLAIGAWGARRVLVRVMESRIAALPKGWQRMHGLRAGRLLGTFRLAACVAGRVRLETTPCSWLVRWMFEKFFAAGTLLILGGVVVGAIRGTLALPGFAELLLIALVLVVPACIGGFLLARIEWVEVRERDGRLVVARGLTLFMLPIRGGWRSQFHEAEAEDDDAYDRPPSWYLISSWRLTPLDLWHVRMLRAAITSAFPAQEQAYADRPQGPDRNT
jgi:hypothetical protein